MLSAQQRSKSLLIDRVSTLSILSISCMVPNMWQGTRICQRDSYPGAAPALLDCISHYFPSATCDAPRLTF